MLITPEPKARVVSFFLMGAVLSCGPSTPGGAKLPVDAPRAGSGGSPVSQSSGGTGGMITDARGFMAVDVGTQGGGVGGTSDARMGGDSVGSGDGRPGGSDARLAPGSGMLGFTVPAESEAEKPLPACKKEVNVASDAALPAALVGAMPGDCLILADGNYKAFKLTAVGTAEAPIVIRSQNRGKAVLASGQLTLQGTNTSFWTD